MLTKALSSKSDPEEQATDNVVDFTSKSANIYGAFTVKIRTKTGKIRTMYLSLYPKLFWEIYA